MHDNINLVSPDANADGITAAQIDPLRYDGHTDDPSEVAGLLRSLMPERVRVLDVGCGTGSVNLIVNRGKQNTITGIEPDDSRASVARSRGLSVHTGFLTENLLNELGQFDVVMASDVLEHVPAPSQLLALMVKATKPGGHILVSVPNVAHWSVRLSLALGKFDYEPDGIMDATHLRWFTEKTARRLVEGTGCRIEVLRQTAGASLGVYHRRPLSWVPTRARASAVRSFTRLSPRLFGVQHVIKAQTPIS